MNPVNIIVMIAAGSIGLVGLAAASRAVDSGMYIFGLVMFAFAILMNFLLLKRHFDDVDAKSAR